MQRTLTRMLPLFAIIFTIGRAQEANSLKLDEMINEAIQNNPQLRAARYRTDAAKTRIGQVTSWDAPQIGMEFFKVPVQSFPDPLRNNMEMDYYAQQMIPFPGKLSAKGSAAENYANMADQDYDALERQILRNLKSAYYGLYLVQHKIRINADNQDLLKSFVDIARKQYEVGMGMQPDILRAQTELSKLVNDGINLREEQKVDEAKINTILNRPADSTLGTVPELEVHSPPWTFSQLRQIALESRPELKAVKYAIGMNKSELTLSRREYFPDLMARVMYKDMAHTNNDFWSLMIGISIPLAPWSSGAYTAKAEENELNVRKAEDEYAAMRNTVLFEVQDALVKVQTSANLESLYKTTVIPQAEQTLQSTIIAYQTGKTEFLTLIDAYRVLLESRLDYYTAVMNYMTSRAALEQAVGLNIDEIAQKLH
jgi:cobalt-zinc-cadmium efflux system outer membrane protein